MPPSVSELIAATGSTTDASSYSTASISPTAGSLLLVGFVAGDNPANLQQPTLTGCGLTWTAVRAALLGTGGTASQVMLACYAAYADPAVVSSGTLTFSSVVSSGTADGAIWCVHEITGYYLHGGNPAPSGVINVNSNTATADTMTITQAAAQNSESLMFSWAECYNDGSSTAPTFTNPTGWTGLTNTAVSFGSEAARLGAAYNTASDNTANWAASSTNDRLMGISVEIIGAGRNSQPRIVVHDQAVHRASRW